MSSEPQVAPLINRPLDPIAASKVKVPGVGVIITPQTNFDSLVREASDVAQIRGRNIYIFLISDELDEIRLDITEWRKNVYQKCHALKIDRMVIPHPAAIKSLEDYCKNLDVRLIFIEQLQRKYAFPWSRSLVEEVTSSQNLPPTMVLRTGTNQDNKPSFWKRYEDWVLLGISLGILAIAGLFIRGRVSDAFDIMIHILTLAILSSKVSRFVSAVASILGALSYNIMYVEPYGLLKVEEPFRWLNLFGLVAVSFIVSTLSWQVRSALAEVQLQERKKSSFFLLTRELLQSKDITEVVDLVEKHVQDIIGSTISVFVLRNDQIETLRLGNVDLETSPSDKGALEMALYHNIESGLGTKTNPLAYGLYIPVTQKENFSGCMAVYPRSGQRELEPAHFRMLDTYTSLLGLALDRIWQEETRLQKEAQVRDSQLQNTLLKSVSHDLKTPLTTITGYANQLYDNPELSSDERKESYRAIRDQSWRLTNLINNLLSMTKLESGILELNKERMFVEELLGTATAQTRNRLNGRKIEIDLPDNVEDVYVDPTLLNQALVNLIENAIKYTPEETTITLRGRNIGDRVQISVLDDGPGLPADSLETVFEKFVRHANGRNIEGTGLGLAIVKTIAELHDGSVTARNRTRQGARFDIRLPVAKNFASSEPEIQQ